MTVAYNVNIKCNLYTRRRWALSLVNTRANAISANFRSKMVNNVVLF